MYNVKIILICGCEINTTLSKEDFSNLNASIRNGAKAVNIYFNNKTYKIFLNNIAYIEYEIVDNNTDV